MYPVLHILTNDAHCDGLVTVFMRVISVIQKRPKESSNTETLSKLLKEFKVVAEVVSFVGNPIDNFSLNIV